MHPNRRLAAAQQQRVREYAGHADSYAMFNLLTGPQLLDRVEVSPTSAPANFPVHPEIA